MDQLLKSDAGSALGVVAAFGVGYLLGRTRRSKLAAGVGLALVARGVGGGGLTRTLAEGPLGKAAGEAVGGLSRAAGEALNVRIERLTEALHERTVALEGEGGKRDESEAGEDQAEGAPSASGRTGAEEGEGEDARSPGRKRERS